METPENGPQEEEKEESRFGESQIEDTVPLEPGETAIPFSDSADADAADLDPGMQDLVASGGLPEAQTAGQETVPEGIERFTTEVTEPASMPPGEGGTPAGATKSEEAEDLTTEGDPPPQEGGDPPPEAFEPYPGPEQGPTPPWPGGAPEKGPEVTPGPPSTEAAPAEPPPAWAGETSRSGRREGVKPRKPGRKPGPKSKTAAQKKLEEDNPMVVVQPAPDAPILVVAVKFMDVAQIFNNAKSYLRVTDPMSGGYSDLELWVDRGILWVRRFNVKDQVHETNCVPLSNVQSFTPA